MPNDNLVYWDSVVFIDLIEETPGRHETLKAISDSAERAEARIVTSALTLAEVSKLNNLRLLPEWAEKKILEFFENDYITVRDVSRPVCEMARPIIRGHGLKPPDAIHVATALMAKAQVLHTYDGDLLGKNGLITNPLLTGCPPLRIEVPRWQFQGDLPLPPPTATG